MLDSNSMSRFNRVLTSFKDQSTRFKTELSLDFGSSQTRIMRGQELVWQEATLLAWHQQLQSVVAVGDQALDLAGKTPAQIKLIAPIKNGQVAELNFAQLYLQSVLKQLPTQSWWQSWWPVGCCAAIPNQTSPVEQDQLQRTMRQAGLSLRSFMPKSQALLGLTQLKDLTQAHGVIDLGAQVVEVGVFVGQEPLLMETLVRVAGDDFTTAINKRVLTDYNLIISRHGAEQVKRQIGTLLATDKSKPSTKAVINGKQVDTQTLAVQRVEAASFRSDLVRLAEQLALELKQTLSDIPAEVMSQLTEQGFYATGGASQLTGFKEFLEEKLQLPILLSTQPTLDVVKGLAASEQ